MKVENIFLDLVNGMTDEKIDNPPAADGGTGTGGAGAPPAETPQADAPANVDAPGEITGFARLPGESNDAYFERYMEAMRQQGKVKTQTTIPFGKYTGRDFNEMLRNEIGRVVDGEIECVTIALRDAATMLEPEEFAKRFERSRSYIRTIMDKSPKVAVAGKTRMKVSRDDDGMQVWSFTVDTNPVVRKNRTKSEINKEAHKAALEILKYISIPTHLDLDDDEIVKYAKVLRESKNMAMKMFMSEHNLSAGE